MNTVEEYKKVIQQKIKMEKELQANAHNNDYTESSINRFFNELNNDDFNMRDTIKTNAELLKKQFSVLAEYIKSWSEWQNSLYKYDFNSLLTEVNNIIKSSENLVNMSLVKREGN